MKEVALGNLCNVLGGKPNPKTEKAFSESKGLPFVKMKDLGSYHLTTDLINTEKKLDLEYAKLNGFRIIKKGSILLPRSGSVSLNHRAIIGTDVFIVSHIFALEIIDENIINNFYLYYYLLNIDLGLIANKTTGLDSITKERLEQIKIPVPEIEEQIKIVTLLNSIQNIEIKRNRNEKSLKKLLFSAFYDLFGDPINNSYAWKKTKKLSELGVWITGGTPPTKIEEYYLGKIPWFTSGELNETYIKASKKYITKDAIANSNAKLIPVNSIMIGMYDTAAFKMSINKIECSCNQAVIYTKLYDERYTLYVFYALKLSREYFLQKRRGARQKNLSSTYIKDIKIPIPNDFLIIEKFEKIHNIINHQIEKSHKIKELLRLLFNSYLEHLFIGKNIDSDSILFDTITLRNLIKDFHIGNFVNKTEYDYKRDLLFDLLEKSEKQTQGVKQYLDINNDKIELQVK